MFKEAHFKVFIQYLLGVVLDYERDCDVYIETMCVKYVSKTVDLYFPFLKLFWKCLLGFIVLKARSA